MTTSRKLRTRTLIQLGGLLKKSGILDYLEIQPGDDLQQDVSLHPKVAELYGALLDIKTQMRDPSYSPTLFTERGKKGLGE